MMNERIRELAEQANILIGKDSYGKFAVVPGHEKDPISRQGKAESFDALEKFAELIVKECAETIRGSMIKHCTGVVLNTDYNLGLSKASTSIKEHFGVEE